jgi:hypothetical protein
MNLINKTKHGDCSFCPNKDTDVIKRGKEYFCQTCKRKADVKKQMAKAKERNAVRNLSLYQKVNKADVEDKVLKEKWFGLIRNKLTGTCQCGCGKPSSKHDYKNLEGKIESHFRSSCCHIFPKSIFESIKYHPRNYVERAFWGGCHSVMDDTSMDRWSDFADWNDIVEKFHELAPLLTDEERATKFYSHLERLIYKKAPLNK